MTPADQTKPGSGAATSHEPARLGILMLETKFPRILGDMGNPATWPFPVAFRVVEGASPERVVHRRAEGLLEPFIAAARELIADGADGIATTCGFLSLFQADLSRALQVPVATSSLLQAPMIRAVLPAGRRVGIITVNAPSLTPEHLAAAGVPPDSALIGTETGREFTRVMLGNEPHLDSALAERDIIDAGLELIRRHADVGALLLECTNMAPYSRALATATRLPVYDIYSFMCWFHAGLRPRAFVP